MEVAPFIDEGSQPGDQAPVALGMAPHDLDQMHQPGRLGTLVDRKVNLPMQFVRCNGISLVEGIHHSLTDCANFLDESGIHAGPSLAECLQLQCDPSGIDITKVVEGNGRYPDPFVGDGLDQSFDLELAQRFSDRNEADPVGSGEPFDSKWATGWKVSIDDRLPQPLVSPFDARTPPRLSVVSSLSEEPTARLVGSEAVVGGDTCSGQNRASGRSQERDQVDDLLSAGMETGW